MGIQINGQTDTISAVDGALTVSGAELSAVTNLNATGIVTATSFSGPLTGNVNSSGVSTITTLRATSIVGVNTVGVVTVYASGSLQTNSIVPVGGIPAGASGGGIIQVVQNTITAASTFNLATQTWSSTSIIPTSITPRSTSNKILVCLTLSGSPFDGQSIRLKRGSTPIFVGDAFSSRAQASVSSGPMRYGTSYDNAIFTLNYVDSPATTSPVTYDVDWRHFLNTTAPITINAGYQNAGTSAFHSSLASTMILMEVSG